MTGRTGIAIFITSVWLGLCGAVAAQEAPPLPLLDDAVHVGVAGCYGSTCHSRQTGTGQTVRQNEVITWQDETSVTGAHARAYKILLEPRSQAMARNLGIGPAHEARECLVCHADAVPADKRGERFQIADGVGCEACHGGAEDWLTSHYAGDATHADNLARGLYPTDDPLARAELCISCHLGSGVEQQFVTHRIMGAGHPRLSFELDLFTALQRHHDEDADYAERKGLSDAVKVWAIGQSVALRRSLDLLTDPQTGRDGLFPELVFFDCHACHRPISDDPAAMPSWRPNPGRPLGPGIPTLNDSNILMLTAAAKAIAPGLADQLDREARTMHAAVLRNPSALQQAAKAVQATAARLTDRFVNIDFTPDQTRTVLTAIVSGPLERRYTNYAGAEQAVMAIDTLVNALLSQGAIPNTSADRLLGAIDVAYGATKSPNSYNPSRFRNALQRIAQDLRAI